MERSGKLDRLRWIAARWIQSGVEVEHATNVISVRLKVGAQVWTKLVQYGFSYREPASDVHAFAA
jgi:hypothetical protein